MAVITPEALNPTFNTPYASIGAMEDASAVRTTIDTKFENQNSGQNLAIALLEKLQAVLGNGALSGGTIAAGVGLSVDIAALEALVGTWVGTDDVTTVGGLTASSVNYLFLRQNGEFSVNTTGADPSATAGDFLLWGTATCDGSGVTAVSNSRTWFPLRVDDTGTATAVAGAATSNTQRGTITSEALTTAAGASYTLTLTCNRVSSASQVFASVQNGTNTQGKPVIGRITPGSGSVTIEVWNLHAADALNGTLKIAFKVE